MHYHILYYTELQTLVTWGFSREAAGAAAATASLTFLRAAASASRYVKQTNRERDTEKHREREKDGEWERERESQHPSVSYHHGSHKYICKHACACEFNTISTTLAAKWIGVVVVKRSTGMRAVRSGNWSSATPVTKQCINININYLHSSSMSSSTCSSGGIIDCLLFSGCIHIALLEWQIKSNQFKSSQVKSTAYMDYR